MLNIGFIFAHSNMFRALLCLYLIGEIFFNRKWKPLVWLVVLTLSLYLLIPFLKNLFKVPLVFDPTRYGFPSGHTFFYTTIYGWFCFRLCAAIDAKETVSTNDKVMRKTITIACYMMLLFIIGCWTVAKGFHTWFDIVGGWIAGSLLLSMPILLTKRFPKLS